MKNSEIVKSYIRQVQDFPKPGILFYDISTVLEDARGFKAAIDSFEELTSKLKFDLIAGIDSRGFIFGAALADRLGKGLILIRKSGKLPSVTQRLSYALEYGEATLEINSSVLSKKPAVIVVDDLLATGGTANAAQQLVAKAGGQVVASTFLIELGFLEGRKKLGNVAVHSVLSY